MLPSMKAHPKAVYEICNTDDDDDEDDAQHDQRQVELAPLFGRSPLAAAPSRHPDHASAGSKPFFTRVQHTCHQCHIWLLGLIIIFIAGVVAWLMLSSPNAHDAQAMDAGHEQHTSIPCWVYPGHNTSDAIAVVVSLTAHQTLSCVFLHAVGMQVHGVVLQRQRDTHAHCLCGQASCHVHNCTDLITHVNAGADQHGLVISLGDHMLAHNATAMLSITYSARLGPMGEGTGLYRSHPFATPNMTGGAGEQGSPEGNERGNGIAMVGNGRRLGDDTMDTTNTTSGNQSSSVPSFSVMVVSQFEALGARRLLPCVDLPAAKAVFVLERLQVPAWATALFNTQPLTTHHDINCTTPIHPAEGSPTPPSHNTTRCTVLSFAPTPTMSPYTMALAVGVMEAVQEGRWVAHAAPGKGEQLHVPVRIAGAALEFYQQYAGVDMPPALPVFQAVAVPGMTWAMENWGLLLFDEERFLFDPATADAWDAYRMVDVICHEVGHQVFGNLVTCADWRQLAVNEGVASYVEYKCIAAVMHAAPAEALRFFAHAPTGAPLGSHEGPLRQALAPALPQLSEPVVPAQGRASGGVVTYSKGAALLTMVQQVLDFDQQSMQAVLQRFVSTHAYSTAGIDDLLTALLGTPTTTNNSSSDINSSTSGTQDTTPHGEALQQNMQWHALRGWFMQPGFPLLVIHSNTTTTTSSSSSSTVEVLLQTAPCADAVCLGTPNHIDTRQAPLYTPALAAAPSNRTWVALSHPGGGGQQGPQGPQGPLLSCPATPPPTPPTPPNTNNGSSPDINNTTETTMSVDVGAAVVDGGCVVNHDGNNHYRLVYADAQRTRAVLHAQLRSVGACDTSTPQGMECVQLYAAQAAGLVDDAVYAGMVGAVPLEDVVDVLHTVTTAMQAGAFPTSAHDVQQALLPMLTALNTLLPIATTNTTCLDAHYRLMGVWGQAGLQALDVQHKGVWNAQHGWGGEAAGVYAAGLAVSPLIHAAWTCSLPSNSTTTTAAHPNRTSVCEWYATGSNSSTNSTNSDSACVSAEAGMWQLHVAGGCAAEVDATQAWHAARACWNSTTTRGGINPRIRCMYGLTTTRDDALRNKTLEFIFGLDLDMPPPPVKHTSGMLRMLSLQRSTYTNDTTPESLIISWLQHNKQRIVDAQQSTRLIQALSHVVWPATPAAHQVLKSVLDMPACGHGGSDATCRFVVERTAQHVQVAAEHGVQFCDALTAMMH